jgi:hypothetical protein
MLTVDLRRIIGMFHWQFFLAGTLATGVLVARSSQRKAA